MHNFAKLGIGAAILCGAVVAAAAPAAAQGYGGAYGAYRYSDQNPAVYGERRGYRQYDRAQNYDPYTGRNMANIVNFIIDPMSGRRITQAEYQARYPWTDSRTWTYDSFTNLWTDHTLESGYAYQENNRGRYRRY
jgi:hypothetical protein